MNKMHNRSFSRREMLRGAAGTAAGLAAMGTHWGVVAQGASKKYSGNLSMPLYTQLPDNIPFIVGFAKGFFEEQGLELKPVNLTTGPDVIRSVMQQTHLGCSSPVSGMVAHQNGFENIRIVGACMNAPSVAFLVKPDSPIKDVSQLKGKNIGVNAPTSITTYIGQLMLKSAGLDPMKDANLINVKGVADSATALENNVVDCSWSSPSLSLSLVAQGKARVLYDGLVKHPTFTQTAMFSDVNFIKQNGDVVQRWINAAAKSYAHLRNQPDESAAIWAKALNIDGALALETVKKLGPSFTVQLSDDGFQQNMNAAVALGLIKAPIPKADIMDLRFVNAVRTA